MGRSPCFAVTVAESISIPLGDVKNGFKPNGRATLFASDEPRLLSLSFSPWENSRRRSFALSLWNPVCCGRLKIEGKSYREISSNARDLRNQALKNGLPLLSRSHKFLEFLS